MGTICNSHAIVTMKCFLLFFFLKENSCLFFETKLLPLLLGINLFKMRKHVIASSTSPNLKVESLISCLLTGLDLIMRRISV